MDDLVTRETENRPQADHRVVVGARVVQKTMLAVGVAIWVLGLVGLVALTTYLGILRLSFLAVGELVGVSVVIIAAGWFMALQAGPDRIEIDSKGVTFQTMGSSTWVPWERFNPKLTQTAGGRLRFTYRTSDRPAGRFLGYAGADLSAPMAHALLVHPSAPEWGGDPRILGRWRQEPGAAVSR